MDVKRSPLRSQNLWLSTVTPDTTATVASQAMVMTWDGVVWMITITMTTGTPAPWQKTTTGDSRKSTKPSQRSGATPRKKTGSSKSTP